jgi:hypothetical protein
LFPSPKLAALHDSQRCMPRCQDPPDNLNGIHYSLL